MNQKLNVVVPTETTCFGIAQQKFWLFSNSNWSGWSSGYRNPVGRELSKSQILEALNSNAGRSGTAYPNCGSSGNVEPKCQLVWNLTIRIQIVPETKNPNAGWWGTVRIEFWKFQQLRTWRPAGLEPYNSDSGSSENYEPECWLVRKRTTPSPAVPETKNSNAGWSGIVKLRICMFQSNACWSGNEQLQSR